MFFGEYDPDKAESWTHKLDYTFETMECAEEDQCDFLFFGLRQFRQFRFALEVQADDHSWRLSWEATEAAVEAEASNLVIGTLPILGRAACVLVDPSVSLCFASKESYESLVRHTPEWQCDVMVDLPSGDYMH
ncbi:hypothetical protein Taro_016887 [Colocasia esculenta]|uniref:Uncharacterized protein n=1 Tax=Colocasia esculenta TaxID=4460 RepID=A0A843ULN3_COLES|nr:hypothetical protein [Colocasia esculenta]